MKSNTSIFNKTSVFILGTLLITFLLNSNILYASTFQIALVYKEEAKTLKKMWVAKKQGDKDEVERLSNRLKEFISRHKKVAQNSFELVDRRLKQMSSELKDSISTIEQEDILKNIDRIDGLIRYEEDLFKFKKNQFSLENYEDRLQIKFRKKRIKEAKQHGAKKIEECIKELKKEKEYYQKIIVEGARKKIELDKMIQDCIKDGRPEEAEIYKGWLVDLNTNIADKTYDPGQYWNSMDYTLNNIKYYDDQISAIKKGLKDGSFGEILNLEDYIKFYEDRIAKRTRNFKDGKYSEISSQIAYLNRLKAEKAVLEDRLMGKAQKIEELKNLKLTLKAFIGHDFITELPKEDSGWIKAIKWCQNSYQNIHKAIKNVKAVKTIVDLSGSGNYFKAADLLLEVTTGQSVLDIITDKWLPKSFTKNGIIKMALKGEISKSELVELVAKKNLPKDLIKRYETLKQLRDDPKQFLKSEAYKEINAIIDANPKYKAALTSFKDAGEIIKNPAILEEQLKAKLIEYGKNNLVDTSGLEEIKEKMAKVEDRIKKIQDDAQNNFTNYSQNITAAAIKGVSSTLENQLGMSQTQLNSMTENIIEIYRFSE